MLCNNYRCKKIVIILIIKRQKENIIYIYLTIIWLFHLAAMSVFYDYFFKIRNYFIMNSFFYSKLVTSLIVVI